MTSIGFQGNGDDDSSFSAANLLKLEIFGVAVFASVDAFKPSPTCVIKKVRNLMFKCKK